MLVRARCHFQPWPGVYASPGDIVNGDESEAIGWIERDLAYPARTGIGEAKVVEAPEMAAVRVGKMQVKAKGNGNCRRTS